MKFDDNGIIYQLILAAFLTFVAILVINLFK